MASFLGVFILSLSLTVSGRQIQGPKRWNELYHNSMFGKLQLNNGLGRTPPMGWNSWNLFARAINETVIRETDHSNPSPASTIQAQAYQKVTMDNAKRVEEQMDTINQQQLKRSKVKSQNQVSIEDLNARKAGNIFQGDVIVKYKAILDKTNKTREVLRADLTDTKGEMTITLNATADLVAHYEDKIIPGSGLSISNFQIAPRTDYDRGDCDCILVLTKSSIVEIIPRVCIDYKFIPSTAIKQLLASTEQYATGSIGVLVTRAKKIGLQYIVDVQDGDSEFDKAQLQMHRNFEDHFVKIEQQLRSNEFPLILFKNIVKRINAKDNMLHTCQSTYIDVLNDKRTLDHLNSLLHSTFEVQGTLKIANAFSSPFHAFCSKCDYKFDTYGALDNETAQCDRCKEQVAYIYSHYLKTILTTDNKQTIHCSCANNIIQMLLPDLQQISYDEYLKDKSAVIFMLRDFSRKG